jgi:multifunctional methyltransferase subunit TRM112
MTSSARPRRNGKSRAAAPEADEAFLRAVHDLVMDVHINEGALVCPNCARDFPIKKGIPNMVLKEDEL